MTENDLKAKIAKSPNDPESHHLLGGLLYQKGDFGGALGSFLMALLLKPDNLTFLQNALHVLGMTSGYQLPDPLLNILAQWGDHDEVNIQDMSMVIHNQYGASPLLGTLLNVLEASDDDIETILSSDHFDVFFNDPLLHAVMQKAIIITPLLEICLTKLRRHVLTMSLKRGVSNHAMSQRLDFLTSFACQCFNTEYAYAITEEEQNLLSSLSENADDDNLLKWAIIASYQPLHTVLTKAPVRPSGLSSAYKFLLERQFFNYQDELSRRENIVSLTAVNDDISKKVQQQYEQYPYPRWIRYAKGRPQSFKKFICTRFPDQTDHKIAGGTIDLLIPGCGTGMQICKLASSLSPAKITALDISRTSLAYAMRSVEKNGFKKITFFHGDIIEMGDCDLNFDYIDCTGVLHHLAQPEKGLKNLSHMLRGGGYMRLALYSERGRQDVIAARDYVREQGFDDSAQGVRDFRQALLKLPADHPIFCVSENQDFYSISGLHDLIFNVNENRYSPKELKAMLHQEGLEFLGFDHMNTAVPDQYAAAFPHDPAQRNLENWDAFEKKHPETFGFMYHFWCRKPIIS